MSKQLNKALLFCVLAYVPIAVLAWGVEGHRVVAQIADHYLTSKARTKVAAILAPESMAMVSNWGDFIRSDSNYKHLASWHYINLKSGMTEEDVQDYLKKDTTTDVYTKINEAVKELRRKTLSPANKAFYLRMLIHLVGDIHQPLHAGRPEDLGGNKIRVLWFNEPKNLHQVWDDQLVLFQQLSYTEYTAAIDHPTVRQRIAWQRTPVNKWVYESYLLAGKIYGDITQTDQRLEYHYNFNYLATLNEQLLKGGLRLAAVLNDIFK